MSEPNFYFILFLLLISGKVFAELAERLGQSSVLGELFAGIILGPSLLSCVPCNESMPGFSIVQNIAHLGICVLLFQIGLESSFSKMVKVGTVSFIVATTGVLCPFLLAFIFSQALQLSTPTALFIAATLTATSVGLTVRVLSDLKRHETEESQIILSAAIIDDVFGLMILSIVSGIATSGIVSFVSIEKKMFAIVGFFILVLLAGSLFIRPFFNFLAEEKKTKGAIISIAFCFLLIMAYYADHVGMAAISGAFLAGMLLTKTNQLDLIKEKTKPLVEILTPLFFVVVGTSVDLKMLNPFNPANRDVLFLCLFLIPIAIAGKFASGFSIWKKGINKTMVGVGMIPRGEVGLVCAQVGLSTSILTQKTFTALIITIIATTLVTPPMLKLIIKNTIKRDIMS